MAQERMRNTTFAPHTEGYTLVPFDLTPVEVPLTGPSPPRRLCRKTTPPAPSAAS